MRLIFAVALTALTLSAGEAARAEKAPVSHLKWSTRWEATGCNVTLAAEENGGTLFRLDFSPPSATVRMLVVDSRWTRNPLRKQTPATLVLQPSGRMLKGWAYPLSLAASGFGFAGENDLSNDLGDSTGVAVGIGGRRLVELSTPNLSEALASLRKCEDDLLKGWGIDPAAYTSLRKHPEPIGSPSAWADYNDYPMVAALRSDGGETIVKFTVGADGTVSGCVPVLSSGNASLDARSCRIIEQRGRFSPAIASDGTPVSSATFVRYRWSL